ncbi:hypothetical protein DM02DRAFT_582997 [Periconia macrospinosa]|uniref:Uncharacterized protein n=1 Tax=Periconia macrospinosa TaxID=97972 RepID=A0A2V1E6A0_9PLEO|nr:hypothetical protein DM02DRAFT_582997 [Periconia macrospinosa]
MLQPIAMEEPITTTPLQTLDYANSKDWLDIMKNRSKLRMHELIERLGLRAKWSQNKRGKTNFESALVRDLVTDMGDVVSTLPKDADELIKYLSDDGSMNEQVEELLKKHGSAIWGRMAGENREHLITAGEAGIEEGVYPTDLYYENEEDKATIRRLLHWWLGMKAINVILARERLERERKKKEDNKKARIDFDSQDAPSSSFVALAPNSGIPLMPTLNTNLEPPRHMQFYQVENLSRDSPISTSMVTPTDSNGSPIVPGRGSLGNGDPNGNHLIPNGPTNGYANGHSNGHPHGHANGYANGYANGNAVPINGQNGHVEGTWGMNGSRNGSISSQAASSWSTTHASQPTTVDRRRSSLATEIAVQPPAAASATSAAMRQFATDTSQLVSTMTASRSTATAPTLEDGSHSINEPYRGLDEETLQALRAYIYHEETSVQWDEEALLLRIEAIWRNGVRSDRNILMDNLQAFVARERAILTWIELKRHLADLDRADKRWREEGTSAPEIERRIQQHRTLMSATRELLRAYQDIAIISSGRDSDNDELLRQAFVVLAGSKYAVEMQWANVEFDGVMRWLSNHLEAFMRDEEEQGEGRYYLG